MDIQRWLKETAEAGLPPIPFKDPGSAFFHRPERSKPVFKETHTRKRTKSDSSLLVSQPHSHVAPPGNPELPIETASAASVYSEASRRSRTDSTESESSSQSYARRPRRKTRPERYEPKANKERGKHVHPSRKDESKKPRRKSKHKKGEKSDGGVAQSFHAKNVSRDRLTLKPREHLGIFNKGKTSTAVRGRGLPDLVFSEMKFLQKEKSQPEPDPQQVVPKKKRKKDHAHTKEDEISAFFTVVRPALAEKDNNVPTNNARVDEDTVAPAGGRDLQLSTKSSSVVPTVELPGNGSYLGFGSRGPRHESTSYVSWPKSVRTQDITPKHPKHLPAVTHDRHGPSKHYSVGSTTSGVEDTRFKRPAPPTVTKQRGEESTERFQISSVAPSQSRLSRSHSYPQHTSSPRKVNLVDRAAKFRSTQSFASPSSMPPFVPSHVREESSHAEPRLRSRLDEHVEMHPPATHQRQIYQPSDVADEDHPGHAGQGTSSDLGRVIQHCDHSFRAQRRATEPHMSRVNMDSPHMDSATVRHARTALSSRFPRRPTVRFSGNEQPAPRVPNFSGRSIYEDQAERLHVPMQDVLDEEDLLDDAYLAEQEVIYQQGNMMYTEPDWEEHLDEPPLYWERIDATTSGDMVQRLASDNSISAPGFWRPNRLY